MNKNWFLVPTFGAILLLTNVPAHAICGKQCKQAKNFCTDWRKTHPGEECGTVRGYSCTGKSWKKIEIVNSSWTACRLVRGEQDHANAEARCAEYRENSGGKCSVISPACKVGWVKLGEFGKFRACRPKLEPSEKVSTVNVQTTNKACTKLPKVFADSGDSPKGFRRRTILGGGTKSLSNGKISKWHGNDYISMGAIVCIDNGSAVWTLRKQDCGRKQKKCQWKNLVGPVKLVSGQWARWLYSGQKGEDDFNFESILRADSDLSFVHRVVGCVDYQNRAVWTSGVHSPCGIKKTVNDGFFPGTNLNNVFKGTDPSFIYTSPNGREGTIKD